MSKRLPPRVVSSTPVRRKSRAAPGAAQGALRKNGVLVVPIEHATKRGAARLRIPAVKISKQKQGLG